MARKEEILIPSGFKPYKFLENPKLIVSSFISGNFSASRVCDISQFTADLHELAAADDSLEKERLFNFEEKNLWYLFLVIGSKVSSSGINICCAGINPGKHFEVAFLLRYLDSDIIRLHDPKHRTKIITVNEKLLAFGTNKYIEIIIGVIRMSPTLKRTRRLYASKRLMI